MTLQLNIFANITLSFKIQFAKVYIFLTNPCHYQLSYIHGNTALLSVVKDRGARAGSHQRRG